MRMNRLITNFAHEFDGIHTRFESPLTRFAVTLFGGVMSALGAGVAMSGRAGPPADGCQLLCQPRDVWFIPGPDFVASGADRCPSPPRTDFSFDEHEAGREEPIEQSMRRYHRSQLGRTRIARRCL